MRISSSVSVFLFSFFSLLPFMVWTIVAMTNSSILGYSGVQLFASYAAIMLSFLNGIISGQILNRPPKRYSRRIMAGCHAITLFAWITILMGVPTLAVLILLLGYISAFWLEARFLKLLFSTTSGHSKIHFSLVTVICVLHVIVIFPQY